MHTIRSLIILLGILMIIIGGQRLFAQKNQRANSSQIKDSQNIITQTPSSIPSPTVTQQNNHTTPSPTLPLSITHTPSQSLKYPTALYLTSEGNTIIYESTDDTQTITNWYKEKIVQLGMSSKTFVTTKTDHAIKTILVGANGNREVRIEITKNPEELATRITITTK